MKSLLLVAGVAAVLVLTFEVFEASSESDSSSASGENTQDGSPDCPPPDSMSPGTASSQIRTKRSPQNPLAGRGRGNRPVIRPSQAIVPLIATNLDIRNITRDTLDGEMSDVD